MSCHQSGAGIYPPDPWSESNSTSEIRKLMPNRDPHDLVRRNPSGRRMTEGSFIENKVQKSHELLALNEQWIKGCGTKMPEALECRKLLVKIALGDRWDNDAGSDANFHQLQKILKKNWPENGVPLYSHYISDIEEKVEAALESPQVSAALQSRVFQRRSFSQSFFTEIGMPIAPATAWEMEEQKMEKPVASTSAPLANLSKVSAEDPHLRSFVHACASCNVGNGDGKLDFMQANSAEELWKKLTRNPEILSRVQSSDPTVMMPPQVAAHELSENERQMLVHQLKLRDGSTSCNPIQIFKEIL